MSSTRPKTIKDFFPPAKHATFKKRSSVASKDSSSVPETLLPEVRLLGHATDPVVPLLHVQQSTVDATQLKDFLAKGVALPVVAMTEFIESYAFLDTFSHVFEMEPFAVGKHSFALLMNKMRSWLHSPAAPLLTS